MGEVQCGHRPFKPLVESSSLSALTSLIISNWSKGKMDDQDDPQDLVFVLIFIYLGVNLTEVLTLAKHNPFIRWVKTR
jgi:hypothetical protein